MRLLPILLLAACTSVEILGGFDDGPTLEIAARHEAGDTSLAAFVVERFDPNAIGGGLAIGLQTDGPWWVGLEARLGAEYLPDYGTPWNARAGLRLRAGYEDVFGYLGFGGYLNHGANALGAHPDADPVLEVGLGLRW